MQLNRTDTMQSGAQPPVALSNIPESRLEAILTSAPVEPRPMSRGAGHVSRHANPEDHDVCEFDLNLSLCHDHYPFSESQSLPDLSAALEFEKLVSNKTNFSFDTNIDCFEMNQNSQGEGIRILSESSYDSFNAGFLSLDEGSLQEVTSRYSSTNRHAESDRALLAFFISRAPRAPQDAPATYGCQTSMTSVSTRNLFSEFLVDCSFAMNLLGRPDYWSPVTRTVLDQNDALEACEFSCQHPRWNLNIQGSPLSAYMKYIHSRNLTVYILAHKERDTSIAALKNLLHLSINRPKLIRSLLEDPFHMHMMLSQLSFEASKYYVNRFRRLMWNQINAVEDHLQGLTRTDREKLGELTRGLQGISQNADSHIANCEVAIMCAEGIHAAHNRMHDRTKIPPHAYGDTADATQYVLSSLKKQKMWFLNYKDRKNGAMKLVYNLVTQNDAANNLDIAGDMRRDSASMSAIATLTMVFLPGTFTAAIFDAGIVSVAGANSFHVSRLWWLWLAITAPLMILVLASWRIYHQFTMRPLTKPKEPNQDFEGKQVC